MRHGHATVVYGGRETGHVGHHSPTQPHNEVGAGEAEPGKVSA